MAQLFFLSFFPSFPSFLSSLPFPPFLFFLSSFLHLFLAALGLRCCAWASSSCGKRGLLIVVVLRLLIVMASLVATGSRRVSFSSCGSGDLERRLSSCGARA